MSIAWAVVIGILGCACAIWVMVSNLWLSKKAYDEQKHRMPWHKKAMERHARRERIEALVQDNDIDGVQHGLLDRVAPVARAESRRNHRRVSAARSMIAHLEANGDDAEVVGLLNRQLTRAGNNGDDTMPIALQTFSRAALAPRDVRRMTSGALCVDGSGERTIRLGTRSQLTKYVPRHRRSNTMLFQPSAPRNTNDMFETSVEQRSSVLVAFANEGGMATIGRRAAAKHTKSRAEARERMATRVATRRAVADIGQRTVGADGFSAPKRMMGNMRRRASLSSDDDADDDRVPGASLSPRARKAEEDALARWYADQKQAEKSARKSNRSAASSSSSSRRAGASQRLKPRHSGAALPGIRRQTSQALSAAELDTDDRECAECHAWLSGDVIAALGKSYHAACFVCSRCSQPMEEFYAKDGAPWCGTCFQNAHPSLKCARCDQLLEGEYYRCDQDCYHKHVGFCCFCVDYFQVLFFPLEINSVSDVIYVKSRCRMVVMCQSTANHCVRRAPNNKIINRISIGLNYIFRLCLFFN